MLANRLFHVRSFCVETVINDSVDESVKDIMFYSGCDSAPPYGHPLAT